jgi:acyl-CoA reductase-like NAD-dependent aldehyde dehydrogenase
MPWNFPIWLPLKGGIPMLMAGNSLLLKPSPTTPQCGLELEMLMHEA